ncbi:MAG: Gfo/Idh/MocA family oxidoreductase [Planctomycetota bacterium]|nr:Gfo/Idh/MocA family oxidoreductase [Planctomycetota bacterium]
MKCIRDLRLAFIGVSHWHVPLYLYQAESDGLSIVAASDPDRGIVDRFAHERRCAAYADHLRLLDEVKLDFVFAFAPHDQMVELALELIRRGIPFAIEKPLGLNTEDVAAVRAAAEKVGVFCAIPFIWRYSGFVADFKQSVRPEDVLHLSFKFVAGPPHRYVATSPWMLDSKRCGGGCMTNLGVHFIDLALNLTESAGAGVLGAAYHHASEYNIETYASALLRLSSGATVEMETGYAYPMDERDRRDNRWNITLKDGYFTLGGGILEKRLYNRATERIAMNTDSDVYYAEFVRITLEDCLTGRTPRAGLPEMERVRVVLDAINAVAGGAQR